MDSFRELEDVHFGFTFVRHIHGGLFCIRCKNLKRPHEATRCMRRVIFLPSTGCKTFPAFNLPFI